MKRFVVVDGQGKQYDRIEKQSLVFSPDSRRMGYVARGDGKWFVVVDGQEKRQYDLRGDAPGYMPGIHRSDISFAFSPDSQRVGYLAHSGWGKFVVVDGRGC